MLGQADLVAAGRGQGEVGNFEVHSSILAGTATVDNGGPRTELVGRERDSASANQ